MTKQELEKKLKAVGFVPDNNYYIYGCYDDLTASISTENGIEFIRVVPDVAHPKFVNWIFEDTPELRQEMEKYSKERR